jgi:hypothetical protein
MKTLNESVVQEEHDSGEPPRPLGIPEEHLANITNILCLGMAQAEFPNDQRCVQNECCLNNGQDDPGYKTQHGIRIRERHDGQADVLGEEQCSGLLPGTSSILDRIVGFHLNQLAIVVYRVPVVRD